jgi:hypothetical protein
MSGTWGTGTFSRSGLYGDGRAEAAGPAGRRRETDRRREADRRREVVEGVRLGDPGRDSAMNPAVLDAA